MSAQFSSFASIIAQSETMNPPQPPANSADLISLDEARDELSGPSQPQSQDESPQPLFQLVPMADFLKEQEIIAATKAALLPKKREKIPPPPPKPKVKKDIDPLELEAEAQAVKECGYENWIGKLQMYRDAHPVLGGLTYVETIISTPLNPRFTCAALVHESANHFGKEIFGTNNLVVTFANKKAAKQYASKKAVEWLIENKHMPADGPVRFPKPVIPPPQGKGRGVPQAQPQSLPQRITSPTPIVSAPSTPPFVVTAPSTSYAQQIPALCQRLGFNVPTYKLSQGIPNFPFWDAHAEFHERMIVDPVGAVKSIFGKKNAKEEVAKVVFSFLKSIERQRREQYDMNDEEEGEVEQGEKRKRSVDATPEVGAKAVKVEA